MKPFAALALAGALAAPLPAAAQGPATIRGTVYDCAAGTAIAGATVRVRNLTDRHTTTLVAGRNGRFSLVGVEPGRYLVSANGPVTRSGYGDIPSPTVARLARVETDDVLDMRIGTYRTVYRMSAAVPHNWREATATPAPSPDAPHVLCDPPLVPPAPTTTSRYIIH